MKILLYSHSFLPKVGGTEHISDCLARGLVERGHSVTLVTETDCSSLPEPSVPYRIVRKPDRSQLHTLVAENDVVHANGASLRCLTAALLNGKAFSWTHQAYQVQCIDGAGWVSGKPAPVTPWASFWHHLKLFGLWPALVGGSKLLLRRLVAFFIARNVAITKHMMSRQPLPRQRLIYNPYEYNRFAVSTRQQAIDNLRASDSTFTFVGRLVTEKGVDDLLYAFALVTELEVKEPGVPRFTLKVIGDGPELDRLRCLADRLEINDRINWVSGLLSGEIERVGIGVIPSAWEEPAGIVALELMAAGKPLIVSESGGLSELAGNACLTFPNRDRQALAEAMLKLARDKELQVALIDKALERSKLFDPKRQVQSYIELFTEMRGC